MTTLSIEVVAFALFISTFLGAVPIFFVKVLSGTTRAFTEGLCAGAMLAASWISLLVPAVQMSLEKKDVFSQTSVVLLVVVGYLALHFLHRALPHDHIAKGHEGPLNHHLKRSWLITLAIALHNFPEGLAVGVGSQQASSESLALVLAICFQNFPEGFIIAAALYLAGLKYKAIFIVTAVTAMIETLSALAGYALFQAFSILLPFGLAFAGGAMLFVVCREMIPESQKSDESNGTLGILVGVFLVLVLRVFVG